MQNLTQPPSEHDVMDACYSLADKMGYKIEPPSKQELLDQQRDGQPFPRWVLKERLPTHAIAYFEWSTDLLAELIKRNGFYESKQQ